MPGGALNDKPSTAGRGPREGAIGMSSQTPRYLLPEASDMNFSRV